MALGSSQPLTEMSTRNLPGGKGRPVGRRVRLTTSPPSVSRLSRDYVGASTSHNPIGLHSLLRGYLFTLHITPIKKHEEIFRLTDGSGFIL
jgi:hypothetical protein